jgi:hypothetical protein
MPRCQLMRWASGIQALVDLLVFVVHLVEHAACDRDSFVCASDDGPRAVHSTVVKVPVACSVGTVSVVWVSVTASGMTIKHQLRTAVLVGSSMQSRKYSTHWSRP